MDEDAKVYSNDGNAGVLRLVDAGCRRLLDVGCGDGANSRLLRQMRPSISIVGITHTAEEARRAERWMDRCFVIDIEACLPAELVGDFDVIVFSHVLEHLRNPEEVVASFLPLLKPGGQLVIAVPNIASWRTRWQLLKGNFQYEDFGVFDKTHLRFFTYHTAARYLLSKSRVLVSVRSIAEGSVPLRPLRVVMPLALAAWLDYQGCKWWPNLFGSQILVEARKSSG